MAACAVPVPDVEYGVELGSSFATDRGGATPGYAALRYDFKPASADAEQPGVLVVGSDNRVSLYLANSATCEWDVLLSGKFEAAGARDSLDCVAIFDGEGFRLESLACQITTKHVRDAPAYRPTGSELEASPPGPGAAGPGPGAGPASSGAAQSLRQQHQQHSPQAAAAASPVSAGTGHEAARGGAAVRPGLAGKSAGGVVGRAVVQSKPKGKAAAAAGAAAGRPPRPPAGPAHGSQGAAAPAPATKKREREEQRSSGGGAKDPDSARKTSRLANTSGPVPASAGTQQQRAAAEVGPSPEAEPEEVDPDLADAFDAEFDFDDAAGGGDDVPGPSAGAGGAAGASPEAARTPGALTPDGGDGGSAGADAAPRARLVIEGAEDDFGDADCCDEGMDIEYF